MGPHTVARSPWAMSNQPLPCTGPRWLWPFAARNCLPRSPRCRSSPTAIFAKPPDEDFMTTRYSRDHEWVRLEGDLAVIGITQYAQEQLGDIVYVELPEVGKVFDKGAEAAVV